MWKVVRGTWRVECVECRACSVEFAVQGVEFMECEIEGFRILSVKSEVVACEL